MDWNFHLNAMFYVIGSGLFIAGSVMFHPEFSVKIILYKMAVSFFIFGSFLFLCAAVQQLFNDFRRVHQLSDNILNGNQRTMIDLSFSISQNTTSMINGVLFVIGSVGFWPEFGTGGSLVGNWFYRCASTLTLLNSICSLIRQRKEKFKLMTIMSLIGAVGFLMGGGFFLKGENFNQYGSFAWIIGSSAFFVSALLLYK